MSSGIKTLLKWIWGTAVVAFICVFLGRNFGQVLGVLAALSTPRILIATGSILAAKLLLVAVMQMALRQHGVNFSHAQGFRIYNLTQLGKYIPGSIWQFVGRIGVYKEAGMQNKTIRDCLVLETYWVVFGAFIIGIALVVTLKWEMLQTLAAMVPRVLLLTGLGIGLAALTGVFMSSLRRRLRSMVSRLHFPLRVVGVIIVLWGLLGIAFWVTLAPFHGGPRESLAFIVGLYALAYAIGFATPFAPAGIGIRETILVLGIAGTVGTETAVILAALNRVLYVFAEIILAFVSLTIRNTPTNNQNRQPGAVS